jgi:hypothetical protein
VSIKFPLRVCQLTSSSITPILKSPWIMCVVDPLFHQPPVDTPCSLIAASIVSWKNRLGWKLKLCRSEPHSAEEETEAIESELFNIALIHLALACNDGISAALYSAFRILQAASNPVCNVFILLQLKSRLQCALIQCFLVLHASLLRRSRIPSMGRFY